MGDNDTVELVFSGRKFRGISKNLLITNSEYFRALFESNFVDANLGSYSFDVSATGFEFLLRYLTTKTINLKRKELRIIENAIFIADHLIIDSFPRALQETLLTSPADVDTETALGILKLLNVDVNEFAEKCFQEFQAYLNVSRGIPDNTQERVFSYEFLILATSRNDFWKIEKSYYCYDFFWNMTDRIEKVLRIVMQNNSPHLQKIRNLLKNLNLECVPWNSLKMLLHHTVASANKVYMLGVQHHFSDLRVVIGSKISAIRVCYKSPKQKTTCFGVLEFDLDKWSWIMQKEATTKFSGKFCVMSRDWVNIFGDSGLMIFRMRDHEPKFVNNLYIGEMCKYLDSYYPHIASCVLGRCIYIFLYHPHPESHVVNHLSNCRWYLRPTLFKLDVFSKEFNDCAWFPVVAATMVAEGNVVYVAGFSPAFNRIIKVFSYHAVSGQTKKIIEIQTTREVGLPQLHLALKQNLLYVFYQQNYWIVDVKAKLDQPIQEKSLDCFFTQGWCFAIMQLCVVEDGIVFLLDINHTAHNCDYLGMLLAFFNTENKVFQPLGFLPNPVEEYRYNLLGKALQVQIERRTSSSNALLQTKSFVDGIADLEKLPHKHSSLYY